ncbi:MAG: LacI family DNA-binding transcriptional regulator [Chloroflexota bacterium]|nr:LacI family DNA-binding transcriptional regulator [Chloroflexota bacterium]
MPVTLQDIAQELDVSIATVSRALRNMPGVAESTRQLVLKAAREQGYYPNLAAQQLQRQRTDTIGFIIPTFGPRFSDPFFSELLAGIGNATAEAEFDLLVSTVAPGKDELKGYRRLVAGRRVDGLLVVRTRRQDQRIAYLLAEDFPFVAFGRTDLTANFPYVGVDGQRGLFQLVEHLIHQGHRHIAFLNAPAELMFAQHRLAGYRQALAAHGIPYDENLLRLGGLTETDGYRAGRQLFCLGTQKPTAVCASNDLMALGVMRAARECGLQVGIDVAIAGFDDIPLVKMTHPPLTSVHQPIYQIGRLICEKLLCMLRGEELAEPQTLLLPELVVRESTDYRV